MVRCDLSLERHHRDAAICRGDKCDVPAQKVMSFVIPFVKWDDNLNGESSHDIDDAQPESRSIRHQGVHSSNNTKRSKLKKRSRAEMTISRRAD